MSNTKYCSWCSTRLPANQLYFIRKNWIGHDCACINCINKPSCKITLPQPLMTVEQYLFSKQKSITRPIDRQSSTRIIEGTATINQQPCQVTLEEVVTVTRRIIINPNQS